MLVNKFASMEFTSLRIVHTNKIWQDNESGWCEIAVYDAASGEVISEGNDMVTFKSNGKSFSIEAIKNVEGMVYYGAKFRMPDEMYHNNLEIEVI